MRRFYGWTIRAYNFRQGCRYCGWESKPYRYRWMSAVAGYLHVSTEHKGANK